MELLNDSRPLLVKADNTEIASTKRIRVRGKSSMTLLPDIYTVDLYNLTDEDIATVSDAKKLSVFNGQVMMLCSGEIETVYVHQADMNIIHTVLIVDGKSFHNKRVSMSIGKGSTVRASLHALLSDEYLAEYLAEDIRLPRGQTFSGRLADSVSMLAKTVNARAFFSQGAVYITSKGKSRNLLTVEEGDIIGDVNEDEGTLILNTTVKGYPVGTIVQFRDHDYRVAMQSFDADNVDGFWKSILTLVDESMLTAYGMEGG